MDKQNINTSNIIKKKKKKKKKKKTLKAGKKIPSSSDGFEDEIEEELF